MGCEDGTEAVTQSPSLPTDGPMLRISPRIGGLGGVDGWRIHYEAPNEDRKKSFISFQKSGEKKGTKMHKDQPNSLLFPGFIGEKKISLEKIRSAWQGSPPSLSVVPDLSWSRGVNSL